MNSKAILQNNLLDIIFENRNKEYGAYALRKYYEERMFFSLLIMFGLVFVFFLFSFLQSNTGVTDKKHFSAIEIHEYKVSDYNKETREIILPVKTKSGDNLKLKSRTETTPRIVDEKLINKTVASKAVSVPSNNKIEGNENLIDGKEIGMNFGSVGNKVVAAEKKEVRENKVLPAAEVMPEYPGGIKALLAYLKKNIHAPEAEMEEGKEIWVRVKFVVNYAGEIEKFVVMESGGEAYDNEVLRVLKKMPLWIPGKSNGKNISVYFTIPVKFTQEY